MKWALGVARPVQGARGYTLEHRCIRFRRIQEDNSLRPVELQICNVVELFSACPRFSVLTIS